MGFLSKLFGKKDPEVPAKPAAPKPAASQAWQTSGGVPQELAVMEAMALHKSAAPPVFLDVREQEERLASGYIPGSVHIPTGDIEARHGELDPTRPVVVYCASGMRSMDVGTFLIEKGFADVSNLNGGMNKWQGPVER